MAIRRARPVGVQRLNPRRRRARKATTGRAKRIKTPRIGLYR